jgi:predicted lipoprotein with Yx(FWY)xxD motif
MTRSTRALTYAVAAAALATVAAGCGSSSSGGGSSTQPAAQAAGSTTSAHTAGLTTKSTTIGTVVADAQGRTVYELVGDPASNPNCTGGCTAIWPPVMAGGHIVVLHGHPVFTFSGDSAPGQTKGEGVKDSWGTWLALDAQGAPIPASRGAAPAPSSSSSSPSGGGGGYGY